MIDWQLGGMLTMGLLTALAVAALVVVAALTRRKETRA